MANPRFLSPDTSTQYKHATKRDFDHFTLPNFARITIFLCPNFLFFRELWGMSQLPHSSPINYAADQRKSENAFSEEFAPVEIRCVISLRFERKRRYYEWLINNCTHLWYKVGKAGYRLNVKQYN